MTSLPETFENLKTKLKKFVLVIADPTIILGLETDASDISVAVCFRNSGTPKASFPRHFTKRKNSLIDEEAYAIIEVIGNWKAFQLSD